MTITLRKASKIRSKVEARITELRSKVQSSLTLTINVDDVDFLQQVSERKDQLYEDLEKVTVLSNLNVELRIMIGEQNENSGINEKLARISNAKSRMHLLQTLIDAEPYIGDDNLTARIEAARKQSEKGRGYNSDTETVGVISHGYQETLKKQLIILRKELEVSQEKVEEFNSRNYISLTDEMVKVFTAENII